MSFMDEDNDHFIDLQNLCVKLRTSLNKGISSKKAKEALKCEGLNKVASPSCVRKQSAFKKVLSRGKSLDKDPWTKDEWNSIFNKRINQPVNVLRDGKKRVIDGYDIVIGDVVFLNERQVIPADMRVIKASEEFMVDNRIITGNRRERKSANVTTVDGLLSENVIFAGTQILTGTCIAIVIKKGNNTVYATLTGFAQKVHYVKHRPRTWSSASNYSISSVYSTSSSGSSSPRSTICGSGSRCGSGILYESENETEVGS